MPLNLDHTFYVVFADFGAKLGIGENVVSDRRELVDNIVRGEIGFTDLLKVVAFNAAEGWSIDCTEDVEADVAAERERRQNLEDFPLQRFAREVA